jgi:hypothetical protein
MNAEILRLEREIAALKQEKEEREKALPAHSLRPHQLLAIEALEEEIESKEKALAALRLEGKGESGPPE